jgi:hypothetical protein
MITMRIKKLQLVFLTVIVAELLAFILEYPSIELHVLNLGVSFHNITRLVLG